MQVFFKNLLVLILLSYSTCVTSNEEVKPVPLKEQAKTKVKSSWHKVTVRFLDFEGGFYGLMTEGGERLLPKGLPKKYKIDGTILKVKGYFNEDMVTIHQWGTVFVLDQVELVLLGKDNKTNLNY